MNIGIVGLGLIGGSLGLDLRSRGYSVLGVSRRPQTCELAINRGIVDDASVHLNLLAAAEIIFVCTPLAEIEPTVVQLIPHLTSATVLTDVGSVKATLVKKITSLWPNFIGGHPMAGTAEQGLDAAQAHLFAGKAYVLTPVETTPPTAIAKVKEIIVALRAQIHICRPEDHDCAVAWISHLPVIASASLIAASMSEVDPNILQLAQTLASSGFRDTSRVGGGNPELGVMMARYNQAALLRSLSSYRQILDRLISAIEQENWLALEEQLQQTQQARPGFLPKP